MSFNLTQSRVVSQENQSVVVQKLIRASQLQGIALQKMSNEKLQQAYGMLGFSAVNLSTLSVCFIFISTIDQKSYSVYGFINGIQLVNTTVGENSIVFVIGEALQKARDHPQKSTEDDEKMVRSYFDALRVKSDRVAKKAFDENQAIQQIKSSSQYVQCCNQIKINTLEVQELCQTIKARKNKVQLRNDQMLNQFIKVQKQKAQISKSLTEYNLLKEQMNRIPKKLDDFIHFQRSIVQQNDFFDQESFNGYLKELITLKKLENQKKFSNL